MMGLSHVLLWFKERRRSVYLLSSVMAFSAAASALLELALMRADDTARYGTLLQWENLTIYLLIISMVWFVYLHFGTARRWLAVAITVLWTIAIGINFTSPMSLVYSEITELRMMKTFWGETFTLAIGEPNPWKALADAASLLILVYALDGSFRAWRGGTREEAAAVGGGIVVFILLAGAHTPLVDAGVVATPYMISFGFLAIVFGMTYVLVSRAFSASRYARQVQADEKRWRLLLENVQLLVVGLDRGGLVNYVNPHALRLLGYERGDILGRPWIDIAVPQAERPAAWDTFRNLLQGGNLPSFENTVLGKTGEALHVRWSQVLLYDVDGASGGTLSIGEDLTPRIRAEHEARRERDALAHVTRVSAMGELVASLAHELNQPLTAMLSNAQAAQRFLATDPPELGEVRDILHDLVKDNQRASDVIRRLRALLTKEPPAFAAVDLCRLARDVSQLLRGDSMIRKIDVAVECPSEPALAHGDTIQLQQVLLNLLLNAFDAVAHLPADRRRITVGISRRRDAWEISVRDQGIGLAPDGLTEVFEPFFSTKRGGMGMGLSIARSIVESHDGRLWAENNSDRGATFCLTLPVFGALDPREAAA